MTAPSTPARLRALVAALPERDRQPWHAYRTWIQSGEDRFSIARTLAGPMGHEYPEIAEHIATVASPPVVLAIADLLDARDHIGDPEGGYFYADVRDLLAKIDALDAAISRSAEQ